MMLPPYRSTKALKLGGLALKATGVGWNLRTALSTQEKPIQAKKIPRHYRVYVPRRYDDAQPTPLLFVLGGFSVDMYWLAEFSEANRLADRRDFIVVYGHPDWRDFGSYDVFSWYVYQNAFTGEWADNPDIEYMENIVDELGDMYNIDLSRVYVSGHSRGGALSILAAFERPDLFAGYCAQAGFVSANDYDARLFELAANASHRVPGVLVHGESDPDVSVLQNPTWSPAYSATPVGTTMTTGSTLKSPMPPTNGKANTISRSGIICSAAPILWCSHDCLISCLRRAPSPHLRAAWCEHRWNDPFGGR